MCTTCKVCAGPLPLDPVELTSQTFCERHVNAGIKLLGHPSTPTRGSASALQRARVLLLQTATKSPHWLSGPVFPTCPPRSEPLSYTETRTLQDPHFSAEDLTHVLGIEASTQTLKAWLGLSPGSLSSASFLSSFPPQTLSLSFLYLMNLNMEAIMLFT